MHTAPNQRLLEWIRTKRLDLTPEGSITRLELWHTVEGEMGERLCTIEMADRDEDEDPDDLTQEVWNVAEEDASTRASGSQQRYVVHLFRGDTREPDEQKAFVTVGKLVNALTGNGTEPPTPRGELAQAMRERNDLHALLIRVCEATAGGAAIALQKEREENERLRAKNYEAEKLRQDMLDRQQERDLQRRDAEASLQQTQMIFSALAQIAPVVLTRLLSPPAPSSAAQPLQPQPAAPATPGVPAPGASPARDAILSKLFESVTPDQMNKLLGIFGAEQVQDFVAVYQSFRDSSQAGPGGQTPN